MPAGVPVYLVHWNAPEWCAAAAASVLDAGRAGGWPVIVVDNGQDHGPPLATLLPAGVRLLETGGNLGYAGGANRAIDDWRARYPDAEVAVIASHDLQVEADGLERLVAAAAQAEDFGILGPVLTGSTRSSGGRWTGTAALELPLCDGEGIVERDWVSGACMLLRRACVTALGGFDERFHSYCEDVDLGLRARAAGWKVGVVLAARTWGLSNVTPLAVALCDANSVLLAARHAGMRAAVGRLFRLGVWSLRARAGSLAVWRPKARRAQSALWASQRARAVVLAGRRWPTVIQMARERSAEGRKAT